MRSRLTCVWLLAALWVGGCAVTEKIERVVEVPPPAPPPAGLQLDGKVGNRYVHAEGGSVAARIRVDTAAIAQASRMRVNIGLVVDTSGSMEGEPIANARKAALEILEALQPGDRLTVVAFHSSAELLVPPTVVSADSLAGVRAGIEKMEAHGTTDLAGGLSLALAKVAPHRKRHWLSRVVLLSDGVPNDPAPILPLAQRARAQGLPVAAFGLGPEYDETLLTSLATRSGGIFRHIKSPAEVAEVFAEEVIRLKRTVARQLVLRLVPGPGVTVHEVVGMQAVPTGRQQLVKLGDLSEGERIDVLVRLGTPRRLEGKQVELLDAVLTYQDALAGGHGREERLYLSARATADTGKLRAGEVAEIALWHARAKAAAAVVQAVTMVRGGQLQPALALLAKAEQEASAAAKRFEDAVLRQKAEQMRRLVTALPAMADTSPRPTASVEEMHRKKLMVRETYSAAMKELQPAPRDSSDR